MGIFKNTDLLTTTRRNGTFTQMSDITTWKGSISIALLWSVQDKIKTLNWDVLPPPLYSPDLASSNYLLFQSMMYGITWAAFRQCHRFLLKVTYPLPPTQRATLRTRYFLHPISRWELIIMARSLVTEPICLPMCSFGYM